MTAIGFLHKNTNSLIPINVVISADCYLQQPTDLADQPVHGPKVEEYWHDKVEEINDWKRFEYEYEPNAIGVIDALCDSLRSWIIESWRIERFLGDKISKNKTRTGVSVIEKYLDFFPDTIKHSFANTPSEDYQPHQKLKK